MFGLAAMDGPSRPCSMAMDYPTDHFYFHNNTTDIAATAAKQMCTTLPDLPSELIDHILAYLSPVDLASVCLVNRTLQAHAMEDHLWQSIVQSNVPGVKVTTPYPCESFRDLYIAHDPHWFLTKYKVWFTDRDLTGKLIIARYDQRRGVIEGYQLMANSVTSNSETHNSPSLMNDNEVEIHEFEPELHLHLDKPVLQMRANSLENTIRAARRKSSTPSFKKSLSNMTPWTTMSPAASATPAQASVPFQKFAAETPMPMDGYSDSIFNTFMLARAIPDSSVDESRRLPFPYGNIWPPPAIPASTRVSAAHQLRDGMDLMAPEERPANRSQISEKSFRIRSWMEMRPAAPRGISMRWLGHSFLGNDNEWSADSGSGLFGQASRPWLGNQFTSMPTPAVTHIGDQVSTYSTLDPELYAPTADQPWKGIWVGDYSAHGCEFLLIKQTHTTPFDEAGFDTTRAGDETDAEFEQRKADARKYRGRLEAIKLTGDPNVPRGECTFVAEDLGPEGYVTTVEEQPFRGSRVVRSKGHIARTGFLNDRYINSQLILISENRLAQFWVGFNHISFFERVDIDKFTVPN